MGLQYYSLLGNKTRQGRRLERRPTAVRVLFSTDTRTLIYLAAYLRQLEIFHDSNSPLVEHQAAAIYQPTAAKKFVVGGRRNSDGNRIIWHRNANAHLLTCISAPVGGRRFYFTCSVSTYIERFF